MSIINQSNFMKNCAIVFCVLLVISSFHVCHAANERFTTEAFSGESISDICQRIGSTCERDLFDDGVKSACVNPCEITINYNGRNGSPSDGVEPICAPRSDPFNDRSIDFDSPENAQCNETGPELVVTDFVKRGGLGSIQSFDIDDCEFTGEIAIGTANGIAKLYCAPITPLPTPTVSPTPSLLPQFLTQGVLVNAALSSETIASTCKRAGLICDPSLFGGAAQAACSNVCEMTVVYSEIVFFFPPDCKVNGAGSETASFGDPGSVCQTCFADEQRSFDDDYRSIQFISKFDNEELRTDAQCKSPAPEKVVLEDFLTKVDPAAVAFVSGLSVEFCKGNTPVDLPSLTYVNEIAKAYCGASLITPSPTPSPSPQTIETLTARVRICVQDLRKCLRGKGKREACCSDICQCLEETGKPLLKKSCAPTCAFYSRM